MKRPGRGAMWLVAAAGAVAIVAASWLWLRYAPRRTPAGQPPLTFLEGDGLEPLRSAFNEAATSRRVVALLSPT